ncbi:TPA: DUF1304 domain-containing protein [Streptococcus pneumoniae]
MSIITIILTTIVALEHFYIFYLESIATRSDATSRVFNMEKEELAHPSVSSLFKNQGIYKALLGVFLWYGIYFSQNLEIVTIFVLFVIGTATYGSLTADKKIILKQGGSAILALISILLFKIHLKVDSNLANPF